jgi:glycine cleavage system transcriptional repressor
MKLYIITVTTSDRVGIVHAVTGAVHALNGNVIELSQTVMRGYFTVLLAVEFTDALDAATLRDAILQHGQRFDLDVVVRPAEASPPPSPVPDGERFILTVIGNDRPGIIHGITGCLAEQGVNIVDLHARTDGAHYSLVMEANLPHDLPPSTIREEIERFGQPLGLEVFVQHENIFLATSEPVPVRLATNHRSQTSLREGAKP